MLCLTISLDIKQLMVYDDYKVVLRSQQGEHACVLPRSAQAREQIL
jgi:hypothetical protein